MRWFKCKDKENTIINLDLIVSIYENKQGASINGCALVVIFMTSNDDRVQFLDYDSIQDRNIDFLRIKEFLGLEEV